MGKGMLVVIMFTALSFLVSVIAVAPLFAAKATQTTPTTKQQTQQGPAQTPATKFKPQKPGEVYQQPKEKFWGLEADHCKVNGVLWNTNNKLTLKLKQSVTINCWYKVKTVPVKDITEADAVAWGKGKSYTISTMVLNTATEKSFSKNETKNLPKFDWADVTKWKKTGGNAPKIWTIVMVTTWSPTQEYLGDANVFDFCVDCSNVIEEYDGGPNNHIYGFITVNP